MIISSVYRIPDFLISDFKTLSVDNIPFNIIDKGYPFFIKNVLKINTVNAIIKELTLWKGNATIHNEQTFRENNITNGILLLSVTRPTYLVDGKDFREGSIGVFGYNYRIGDIEEKKLQTECPTLCGSIEKLKIVFSLFNGDSKFSHGRGLNKNLYIEFMNFPVGFGHVSTHTHQSMFDCGLKYNVVGVFSTRKIDYAQGGAYLNGPSGEITIDDYTNAGDFYVISNRAEHGVTKIMGDQQTEMKGRWVVTFFWY
jgi:hypothetical protein